MIAIRIGNYHYQSTRWGRVDVFVDVQPKLCWSINGGGWKRRKDEVWFHERGEEALRRGRGEVGVMMTLARLRQ